ncbi:MAG: hypothetical protein ACPL7J_04025 [Desulfomonilaceae bacterium]
MQTVLMVGPVPPPFGGIASLMKSIVESGLAKDYLFDIFERNPIPIDCSEPIQRNLSV